MKNKILISISGKARAGKDTLANILIRELGASRYAFGDLVKDCCIKSFDLHPSIFNDDNKDRVLSDNIVINEQHLNKIFTYMNNLITQPIPDVTKDVIINLYNGYSITSPRQLLQVVGTNIGRNKVKDTIWVDALIDQVKDIERAIVTDSRMPNEREELAKLGASKVLVVRPNHDLIKNDSHESENLLGDPATYNYVLYNDASLRDFIKIGEELSWKFK